jgi:hypothetical protein
MIRHLPRAEAVRRVAAHLADRDAFVVVGGTLGDHTDQWLAALAAVPEWHAYLDHGGPHVMRVAGPDVARVRLLTEAVGLDTLPVAVVPKTVPAARIAEALGHPVADDGSQDIVAVSGERGRVDWPALFVDAVAVVEPRAAMQIRAADVRGLS